MINSWSELGKYAADRDYWKERVRTMRQQRVVTVDMGSHHEEGKFDVHNLIVGQDAGPYCRGQDAVPCCRG